MPRDGAYTLADRTEPMLELVCRKCGRFGRYSVARLIAEYGIDKKLPDLRHGSANCPRTGPNQCPVNNADPCAVEYLTLESKR
jgi:DNA polymerase III epsilon subunit-like protein